MSSREPCKHTGVAAGQIESEEKRRAGASGKETRWESPAQNSSIPAAGLPGLAVAASRSAPTVHLLTFDRVWRHLRSVSRRFRVESALFAAAALALLHQDPRVCDPRHERSAAGTAVQTRRRWQHRHRVLVRRCVPRLASPVAPQPSSSQLTSSSSTRSRGCLDVLATLLLFLWIILDACSLCQTAPRRTRSRPGNRSGVARAGAASCTRRGSSAVSGQTLPLRLPSALTPDLRPVL